MKRPKPTRLLSSIGSGVVQDVKNRLPTYSADWRDVNKAKLRILAAATYIFLASALPALAFGEQLSTDTEQLLNVVHVLIATTIGGTIQALFGGQPLLIVGVAEPIVLVYKYCYEFAKDRDELGSQQFLPWMAWVCVWAGIIVVLLAVTNACVYINKFTRFAGESFGALIAILFMQQAIKGTILEFDNPQSVEPAIWRTVNGLWALFLAFGVLLTSLIIRKGRKWRYLNSPIRSFLSDYGVPLLVIAWSGLSYAISGPSNIPTRVSAPNAWDVTSTWHVARKMKNVQGSYIAAALIPGLIIAVLFYFDHNVSSQLAQQEEFNLTRASAYHYDMLLLGIITIAFGLIGLPPINGVIPQSPMHTKALSTVTGQCRNSTNPKSQHLPSWRASMEKKVMSQVELTSYEAQQSENCMAESGTDIATPFEESRSTGIDDAGDTIVVLSVAEQRGSGLLQSLAVAACLAALPAIRCIPTAVIWGYFAFMAAESLPGSQLWDRICLLLTDPAKRYLLLETGHAPYLETVKYRAVAAFTMVQLVTVGLVYALTWAGVAGVLFPIPIMLLVPFRQYILPRIFSADALEALDKMEEEEARPLDHDKAVVVAANAGMISPRRLSLEAVRTGTVGLEESLDDEIVRYRVVHHLSEQEIQQRRSASVGERNKEQNSFNDRV